MTLFIFGNNKIRQQKQRYHTPTTFRVTRRLYFRNSPTRSTMPMLNPPPPDVSVSPPHSTPGTFSFVYNNVQTPQLPLSIINTFYSQPQYILPWDTPGSKTTTLFKIKPSHLTYSAGSSDETTSKRFTKHMDMYLFDNFQVHSVLVGDRVNRNFKNSIIKNL